MKKINTIYNKLDALYGEMEELLEQIEDKMANIEDHAADMGRDFTVKESDRYYKLESQKDAIEDCMNCVEEAIHYIYDHVD